MEHNDDNPPKTMGFWDKVDSATAFLNSSANVIDARTKKSKIVSNKSLNKKIDNLGKELKKHLIIGIITATFFYLLGFYTPSLVYYFTHR